MTSGMRLRLFGHRTPQAMAVHCLGEHRTEAQAIRGPRVPAQPMANERGGRSSPPSTSSSASRTAARSDPGAVSSCCWSAGPERRDRRSLDTTRVRGSSLSSMVASTAGSASSAFKREHAAQERRTNRVVEQASGRRRRRRRRPSPRLGAGIRVVGEPLTNADATRADGSEHPPPVVQLGRVDDLRNGAHHVRTSLPPTSLPRSIRTTPNSRSPSMQ